MEEKDKIKETLKRAESIISDCQKIENSEIVALERNVDAARNKVNALMRQKISLDLTLQELVSLGAAEDKLNDVNENIASIMDKLVIASNELGTEIMIMETAIEQAKSEND